MSKTISSRVILPADELAAVYDPVKHQLTLSAKGTTSLHIINPEFIRLPWIGGLKFILVGWTLQEGPGPVGHEFKFPYEFDTSFSLSLLPYERVTVIDRNHPRGVRVPIRYLGLRDDETNEPKEGSPEEGEQIPERTVLNNNTIYVVDGEPFTISAPASSSSYTYNVNIEYSRGILKLIDAKIEGGRIIWTFIGRGLSISTVVVSEFGAAQPGRIGAWWQEQTYEVHVILKNEQRDVVVA